MTTHTFKVTMTCSGCSGAVTRALTKKHQIAEDKITANLETQEVVVESDLPREDLLDTIKKTGKTVAED